MRTAVSLIAVACTFLLVGVLNPRSLLAQQAGDADLYTRKEVQGAVFSFADSWAAQLQEAAKKTAARAGTPEARRHADEVVFYGITAGFDIASHPNPGVNLLDMMVLVALNNIVWNDYWAPEVYGDAAQPMLDMLDNMEVEIWGFAGNVLTPEQLREIREVIREWRARNPDKRGVNFIRFSDFGALGRKPSLEKEIQPGGLLAPVREAAVAAEEIRVLGDRALYLMVRSQEMMPRRLELAVKEILRSDELRQTLDDISGFRASSERYAAVLENLPGEFSVQTQSLVDRTMEQVTNERQAAINQLMLELAQERQLALEQIVEGVTLIRAESVDHLLEGFGEERKALMADVGRLVQRSELEAEAMITHVFVLAAALLLLYFLLRMVYRYATDRPEKTWAGRVAVAGLLVVSALPVIAAALVYVHYTTPAARYVEQPMAVTDVEPDVHATTGTPRRARLEDRKPRDAGIIRGSETDLADELSEGPTGKDGSVPRIEEADIEEVAVETALPEPDGLAMVPADGLVETLALNEEVMVLSLLFPRAGVEIIPGFEADLAKMAEFLIENPDLRVDIQGHTDARGAASANQALSEARALAVARFLVERGVDPVRIWAVGYGSGRPLASNETVQGRSQNRRVEVRVIR